MTRRLTLMRLSGIVSWPNDEELRLVAAVDIYKCMESEYMVIDGTLDMQNISGPLQV